MEQLIQELKKVKQVDMHNKVFFPYKDLTDEGFTQNDYLQEKLNFAKDLVSKGWSVKESVNYYF